MGFFAFLIWIATSLIEEKLAFFKLNFASNGCLIFLIFSDVVNLSSAAWTSKGNSIKTGPGLFSQLAEINLQNSISFIGFSRQTLFLQIGFEIIKT